MTFEWDNVKDKTNKTKHKVSFAEAKKAFHDGKRIIKHDIIHSTTREKRYFCLGKVYDRILTVRFTVRNDKIRIFGAGYWRTGKKQYEQENKQENKS